MKQEITRLAGNREGACGGAVSVAQAMELYRYHRAITGGKFGLTALQINQISRTSVPYKRHTRLTLLGLTIRAFFNNVKEILFHAHV